MGEIKMWENDDKVLSKSRLWQTSDIWLFSGKHLGDGRGQVAWLIQLPREWQEEDPGVQDELE